MIIAVAVISGLVKKISPFSNYQDDIPNMSGLVRKISPFSNYSFKIVLI